MMCLFSKNYYHKKQKKNKCTWSTIYKIQTKYEEEHYDIYERVFSMYTHWLTFTTTSDVISSINTDF